MAKQPYELLKKLRSTAVEVGHVSTTFLVDKVEAPELYDLIKSDDYIIQKGILVTLVDGETKETVLGDGVNAWSSSITLGGGSGGEESPSAPTVITVDTTTGLTSAHVGDDKIVKLIGSTIEDVIITSNAIGNYGDGAVINIFNASTQTVFVSFSGTAFVYSGDDNVAIHPNGCIKLTKIEEDAWGCSGSYAPHIPVGGSATQYLAGDATWKTTPLASSATPLGAGTATAGTSTNYAREGHIHPAQTSVATLTTGRTFSLTGGATGTSGAFNGGANASIPVTLATPTDTIRGGVLQQPAQGGSGATDLATLVTEFNDLLVKLRNAGIINDPS